MNYGISVLFRAIPLAMALFCFGYALTDEVSRYFPL